MKNLISGLLILFCSSRIFAWGSLAHMTSAQIAWELLDSKTRQDIQKVIGTADFVESSVWADSARGLPEWKFTIWYHFEKSPDGVKYLDNLKAQSPAVHKRGGLVEALYVAETTLLDSKATSLDKENSAKFIIHLVSDIHQPLHTGRVEDNSGNKIPVLWFGKEMTLHQIWDSQIIYLGRQALLNSMDTKGSAKKYSDFLLNKFKNYKISPTTYSSFDEWMHESMVPRPEAYKYKDESEVQYTERFIDIIDERVFLAGLRIAYTLKRIIAEKKTTSPLEQLKSQIINIVGDFYKFVSLKPKVSGADTSETFDSIF